MLQHFLLGAVPIYCRVQDLNEYIECDDVSMQLIWKFLYLNFQLGLLPHNYRLVLDVKDVWHVVMKAHLILVLFWIFKIGIELIFFCLKEEIFT